MMDEQDALQLLIKYRANQCTAQEIAAVESYFIEKLKSAPVPEGIVDDELLEKEIWAAIAPKPVKRRIPIYVRYAAAAIIIITVITSTFYYRSSQNKANTYTTTTATEIMPGGNSATLTLANGQKISLNALNGNVTTNPGVLITNNSGNGVVTYKALRNEKQADEVNTITTPRGGQYQMILSDGTKVVLNSSSTLQFFVSFSTAERKVTLITGEAYFEVAKDPKRPFLVTTKGQTITVLGTHFNVTAYPDETIKTTLAEGSVALTSSSSLQKQLLKPDQQALLLSNNQGFKVIKVNAADEMAWKDGLFMFNQTPLVSVLHQISRWYNVDADYSSLPDAALEGEFSKSLTLSEMLRTIEYTSGIKIILTDERKLKIAKQ
jgi:ferric-dicitrate binding protein FerR (iron transport regulator)